MAELVRGQGFEANPFRGDLPSDLEGLNESVIAFLRELILTLREQHNWQQQGDATSPWELMTELTTVPLINLGAIGRFVHPTYGVMRARYVRFGVASNISAEFGSVVGLVGETAQHSWNATTDIAKSSANAAIGILAAYRQPLENEYGWVIIDGVNLRTLEFYSTVSAPAVGERITWENSAQVGRDTDNTVVGILTTTTGMTHDNANEWQIPPGNIRVEIYRREGALDLTNEITPEQLENIIDAVIAALGLDGTNESLATLVARVADLQVQITTEARARTADNLGQNQQFAALTTSINSVSAALTEYIRTSSAEFAILTNKINFEHDFFLKAQQNLVSRVDGISQVVSRYDARLITVETRTGVINSVPPVTVSLPAAGGYNQFLNANPSYGWPPLQYRRLANNQIVLEGAYTIITPYLVVSGTEIDFGILFILPLGFRPAQRQTWLIQRSNEGNPGSLEIRPNGEVWVYGVSGFGGWNMIPSVSYIAAP